LKIVSFKGALISIFVVASLAAPLLAVSKPSQAAVFPNVDNIIVRGKDTAYSSDSNPPAPIKTYALLDDPPMMMTDQIGSGRVVAFGDVTEYRGSPANDNFVALTDAIFQWLTDNVKSPASINVEWFDGYGVYVTSSAAKPTLDKLRAEGYTITGSASTPINPAGYDILVLPEMQLGRADNGGDPSLLPDQDVANVRNFVQGGGGLLIMSGSDFFGPGPKGNFYKVMNKVLTNLDFGYGGQLYGFQSDSVYDDVNHSTANNDVVTPGGDQFRPIVDVNISHFIGQAYQAATGRTDFRAYGGCSLVLLGKGMAVDMVPTFGVGLPGSTLTFKFYIYNTGAPIPGTENVDLTIDLTITDNSGWSPTLDNSSIFLPEGDSYYVIVRVTIPNNENLMGAEDTITVTAHAENTATATAGDFIQSLTCIAKAGLRIDPTDDAYVRSDQPDTNLGDNTNLEVGRFESATTHENTFYNSYLKFDLTAIPSGKTITEARLYAFCYHAYGSAGQMNTEPVDDDSWSESSITYNNAPTPGATLDTQTVSIGYEAQPVAYSWDVISYIQSEYTGDQVASLEITRTSETPSSAYRWFDAKEWYDNGTHTYLMVIYSDIPTPRVSISPPSQNNSPGESLTYTVNVMNTGDVSDTFDLAVSDNAGWSPTVSPTSVTAAAGENGTATLSVTIPSSAVGGTIDSITVTATSQTYSTSGSDSCTAHALVTGSVEVTIEPISKSGAKGETLKYSVTVTNKGANSDNFSLQVTDTMGWGPTLSVTSTTLAENASRTGIILSITIPSDASVDDVSAMTVTANGTGYDNSATCTATATADGGISLMVYVGVIVVIVVIIAVVLILKVV
jgi:hypothetical protein